MSNPHISISPGKKKLNSTDVWRLTSFYCFLKWKVKNTFYRFCPHELVVHTRVQKRDEDTETDKQQDGDKKSNWWEASTPALCEEELQGGGTQSFQVSSCLDSVIRPEHFSEEVRLKSSHTQGLHSLRPPSVFSDKKQTFWQKVHEKRTSCPF